MAHFIGLGFELTAMVGIGFVLGKTVGENLGNQKLGSASGILLGFGVWVYRLLYLVKRANSKDAD